MPNPHPSAAGNIHWKLAMMEAGFKKGWTNRSRCKAIKRNGQSCGRLAMTRYGLKVCGAHGGYAAATRMRLRKPSRRSLQYRFDRLARRGMIEP